MEIINNKPLKQSLLLCGMIILSLAATLMYAWYHFRKINEASPNRDGAKLIEVQKIAQETPVHPDLKLVSSSDNSFAHAASVSQKYLAPVPCAEIKKYYGKVLTERGWVLIDDGKITPMFGNVHRHIIDYRRGDFFIGFEYIENKEKEEKDCNFVLSFKWSDKGFGLNK
jgi:hypothetical protein